MRWSSVLDYLFPRCYWCKRRMWLGGVLGQRAIPPSKSGKSILHAHFGCNMANGWKLPPRDPAEPYGSPDPLPVRSRGGKVYVAGPGMPYEAARSCHCWGAYSPTDPRTVHHPHCPLYGLRPKELER